jgi:hypothetical protein
MSGERFAREPGPRLPGYECDVLGHYPWQGRRDRAARMLDSVRQRHLSLLWQAPRRRRNDT